MQAQAEPSSISSKLVINKGLREHDAVVRTRHGNATAGVVEVMVLVRLVVCSVANPIAEGVFAGEYVRYCICIIARS